MSLSTLTLPPVARAPGAGAASSVEPTRAWPRHGLGAERIEGTRPQGAHRHALADAMLSLLGPRAGSSTDAAVDGSAGVGDAAHGGDSGETREAVFRFAHALMKDLKQLGGERAGEGVSTRHGWGHRDWSDLPQRVQGLASAVEAQATKSGVAMTVGAPPETAPPMASAAAAGDAVAHLAAGTGVEARAQKLPAVAPSTTRSPAADSPAADADSPTPAAHGPTAAPAVPARALVGGQGQSAAAARAAAQASAEERAVEGQAIGVRDLPQPVTPISAAVHLMQVPSSQLLAAFSALRAAVPDAEVWKTEGGELEQLGDFLQRLSATFEPSVDASRHTGWLLHETA